MKTNGILEFLTELAANNSKEWMDANRSRYDQVKESLQEDAAKILSGLSANQPAFSSLRPKDCLFRQNRDIRFSANKLPYKMNMAAYFAVGGKKSPGPGYYLHLEPGGSFLAGGIWMPGSDILKKIRQEIDYAGSELKGILEAPSFYDYFGEMEGEQLKTSPKDYSNEHPHIKLLRYKSFIVSKRLADSDVASGDHVRLALEAFDTMRPFMAFLDKAIADYEDEGFII
ncbi:DUF2461 domain-containing protein [Cyclobacterium jeungdonense]|uniref:DUF2461 domain-containing protein n=1 Tax=Cyclobacterium jeungdonense TaxID=708087 RepID=A0ABT8C5R1_9BACT|nr:DUF2461 domain-containing protein [Cyclobacterium jeungdonense]MDN3686953.1 DUF2461 domain-containing protein [Cyclobacterium jeungdonense]